MENWRLRVVKLLLDGQQRMTSLYGVVRGEPPKFFDGNEKAFTGLRFHLETETFAFYQRIKMHDDPLWIDVTELMKTGTAGLRRIHYAPRYPYPELTGKMGDYVARLSNLLGVTEIDLHVEEVTGVGQNAGCGGRHIQPRQQRRHEALQGRLGAR